MRSIKFLFVILIGMLSVISFAAVEELMLVPTPKQFTMDGRVKLPRTYRLENGIKEFDPAEMLKDGLETIGILPDQTGKNGFVIRFQMTDKPLSLLKLPESYRLEVTKEGLIVTALTVDGAWRGAGRVLSLLQGPEVKFDEKSADVPKLDIVDYPDLSNRGVHFLPRFAAPSEVLIGGSKPLIRTFAMFGFNQIWLDLWGRMESKSHPELIKKKFMSQKDVRELIRYAKACGMKVFPQVNSIGHIESSGQPIFPLYGISHLGASHGKKMMSVNNIAHPDFYRVWFEYLDEICEVFGKPERMHVGGDEFDLKDGLKLLAKATGGRSFADYYSEFINKTYTHMKEKNGCLIEIAHDMLFPRSDPWYIMHPANGPEDALKVLDRIPKDIWISMWKYSFHPEYTHLAILKSKGFTNVNGGMWFRPVPSAIMARRCYEMKYHVRANMFSNNPHQQGLPIQGEFAWNASQEYIRSQSNYTSDRFTVRSLAWYNALDDWYFYGRPSTLPRKNIVPVNPEGGNPPSAEQLEKLIKINPLFAAAKGFNLPEYQPKKLLPPWDFKEMEKNKTLSRLALHFNNSINLMIPKSIQLNSDRRPVSSMTIFTPDHKSPTTGTNVYGAEFAVNRKGEITVISPRGWGAYTNNEEKGNMAIPKDCTVFSLHGWMLGKNFRINYNDRFELLLLPDLKKRSLGKEVPPIVCRFSGQKPNARIYVTILRPMVIKSLLGFLRMDTVKEKGQSYQFTGKRLLHAGNPKHGSWTFFMWRRDQYTDLPKTEWEPYPIIALEWRTPKGEAYPKQAVFSAKNTAFLAGFTVLGAEEFD